MVLAAFGLVSAWVLPLWTISLDAPQYPEGLGLEIWVNTIKGQKRNDLNSINNLNHYIGMKEIHPESIAELRYMPWIVTGLILAGLGVAAAGRRKLLLAWIVLLGVAALAGLVDYFIWGYDYGHNLDMDRAILKVPGMTYQPPLIGSKQLLNFTAHSWPGAAGWFAVVAVVLATVAYLGDRRAWFARRA
ncbi:MAG: hypothetical protein WEC54_06990 [Gemmatimonadales bacterium]